MTYCLRLRFAISEQKTEFSNLIQWKMLSYYIIVISVFDSKDMNIDVANVYEIVVQLLK